MSTNFYGIDKSEYGNVETHLGQRAGGWEFLFQGDRSRGITGIQSWLRQLETFDEIRDEYERVYTIDEFLEAVEAQRGLKRRQDGDKWGDKLGAPCLDAQEFTDQGCHFACYVFF